MEVELISALKFVAPYAGLAGISVVIFYFLFREFVRKNIFPQLTKEQSYHLFAFFLLYIKYDVLPFYSFNSNQTKILR